MGDRRRNGNGQPNNGDRYSYLERGVCVPPSYATFTVVTTNPVFTVARQRLSKASRSVGIKLGRREFELQADR